MKLRVTLFTAAILGFTLQASAADFKAVTIEKVVNGPADAVWAKVGGFCSMKEIFNRPCEYTSGSGNLATVRKVNNQGFEVMVGQSRYAYTYTLVGRPNPAMLNASLELVPEGANRSKLIYSFIYDAEAQPATDADRMKGLYGDFLEAMRKAVEGK